MIRLNSIPASTFEVTAAEFGGDRERADIVATGRLLMAERNGRDTNAMRNLEHSAPEYTSRIDDTVYSKTNESLQHKMMLYAAKLAANQIGAAAPATYEDFMKQQRRFLSDKTFLRVLAGIVQEVITPVLPVTMSNALGWLCETVYTPIGQTYEINVSSNDIFLFQDDSWGASRSKPSNYLYDYPVTLNPRLRTAKATIKWYQLVGNGADLGRFFNSFAAGLYSKIVALWTGAMVSGSTNATFTPANLQFTTNNSQNWVNAVKRTALVNGTSFRNIIAFGDLTALSKALPAGVVNTSTVNLDAALSTMLGIDWARYGYLAEYMGARLMPIENSIVPGTQNTTITEIVPTNRIWFAATTGYKPVYLAMEEGTPITIELDPSETADMTIDIIVSASMDAAPVFGSKIATMTV